MLLCQINFFEFEFELGKYSTHMGKGIIILSASFIVFLSGRHGWLEQGYKSDPDPPSTVFIPPVVFIRYCSTSQHWLNPLLQCWYLRYAIHGWYLYLMFRTVSFKTGFTAALDVVTDYLAQYCDVIMNAIASQITSVSIVYSSVCSDADQR